METDNQMRLGGAFLILFIFAIIALCFAGCPAYNVYTRTLEGKAEYQHSQWNKKVIILDAQAKEEAAKALAQAEINRAEGVAKANLIIGQSLKGNEAYLKYLWIQGLDNGKNEVIYVPTEANLPILEASRLSKKEILK